MVILGKDERAKFEESRTNYSKEVQQIKCAKKSKIHGTFCVLIHTGAFSCGPLFLWSKFPLHKNTCQYITGKAHLHSAFFCSD